LQNLVLVQFILNLLRNLMEESNALELKKYLNEQALSATADAMNFVQRSFRFFFDQKTYKLTTVDDVLQTQHISRPTANRYWNKRLNTVYALIKIVLQSQVYYWRFNCNTHYYKYILKQNEIILEITYNRKGSTKQSRLGFRIDRAS